MHVHALEKWTKPKRGSSEWQKRCCSRASTATQVWLRERQQRATWHWRPLGWGSDWFCRLASAAYPNRTRFIPNSQDLVSSWKGRCILSQFEDRCAMSASVFVALFGGLFFFPPLCCQQQNFAMESLAQISSGAIRCSFNTRFWTRFRRVLVQIPRDVPKGSGADTS